MNNRIKILFLFLIMGSEFISISFLFSQANSSITEPVLTRAAASNFALLALKCISREYPNKLDHVMNNENEVQSPKTLHPVFYGCFDWHSSVHGHWMLIKILKQFPDLPEAGRIRKSINENITDENVVKELNYLAQPNRKSFERTYGWAWLLKLAEELFTWNDPDGKKWYKNLLPLTESIVQNYIIFLPRQLYPIRTGVHPNTAFGISFALDFAKTTGNKDLEKLLCERANFYYSKDSNNPIQWEPGGEDFFSPALIEADLMRKVYDKINFQKWIDNFLPDLGKKQFLFNPAVVSDRTDPKIVHLDGLNLSRAWCMIGIAAGLNDAVIKESLRKSAILHANSTLPYIASGNYEGEHWLGSFAVYFYSQLHFPVEK